MNKELSSKQVIKTSIIVDSIDIILNGTVAVISGSSIMLAEALQGLADLIAVIFLMIGVKRSARKPNKHYNFGYGKELYFWVMCSAIAMFAITATVSIYSGVHKLINPEHLENTFWAYFVLAFAVISNVYALSVSLKRMRLAPTRASIVKSFMKSHLIEIKATLITDAMGTASASLGIISLLGYWITGDARYDGMGAIVIGVTISIFALWLLSDVKNLIIGKSASPDNLAKIRKVLEDEPLVKKVERIMSMHFGSEDIYVNLNIDVDQNSTAAQIEKLDKKIEEAIIRAVPEVDLVHIEIGEA